MIVKEEYKLRLKSELVQVDEINDLISLLEQELKQSAAIGKPGIGLSAIQCGIAKRAAIVRINTVGNQQLSINLINATIEKKYDPFIFKNEGCLSFDDELYDTKRYREIYVTNNLVIPHSFIATGLMSVAIQHELDHLDGIIFKDHIVKPIIINNKMRPNDICSCGSGKKYKKCACH